MAIVGYARTSTRHQDNGLEAQLARLKAEGCEKIFFEKVSSLGERAKLGQAHCRLLPMPRPKYAIREMTIARQAAVAGHEFMTPSVGR